jgi:hypothetical protein
VAFVDAVARREGETKSGREGDQFAGQKLVVTHLAHWLLTHKFRKQGGSGHNLDRAEQPSIGLINS